MIGYMHYNRFGHAGFTDPGRGRPLASVQTCPVCLLRVQCRKATLPDGTVIDGEALKTTVCHAIKDNSVNGGYQAGCLAENFPAF